MRKEELRIGNIADIEIFGIGEEPISLIQNATITAEDLVKYRSFKGVPLSEDWLVKFGFEKATNGNNSYHLWAYYIKDSTFFLEGSDEPLVNIEYVHHLQNLYFVLTGEELSDKTEA